MVGIYQIESISGKIYIGQSWDIKDRFRKYRHLQCEAQRKLFNSLKKYGWIDHDSSVILELKPDISQLWMNFWEQFFMDYYRSENVELLNLREAGSNGKASPETLIRMSLSNKGKKRTQETKNRISKSKEFISDEYRKNMSNAQRKIVTPERRAKLSAAHKGKVVSQSTKDKLSFMRTGIKHSRCRQVLQFDKFGVLLKEWPYIRMAANELGLSPGNITSCCRVSKNKTCGGFVWKYK